MNPQDFIRLKMSEMNPKKTSTQVEAIFEISGDLEGDIITQRLGTSPSLLRRKGQRVEIIKEKEAYYLETSWEFGTGLQNTIFVEKVVEDLEKFLIPRQNEIIKLKTEFNLEVGICIVIYMIEGEIPSILLKKEFLKLISSLEADINFDIYD